MGIKREKSFGAGRGVPLDRNAKARLVTYMHALNARLRTGRQHKGPLTRATIEVFCALVWGFHNSRDGRCFPSYDAIARKTGCAVSTVYVAIKALEAVGVLTWHHRIARIRERVRDLLGKWGFRDRVIRTSNAYVLLDPGKDANMGFPVRMHQRRSEIENRGGTLIKEEEQDRYARDSARQQLLALGYSVQAAQLAT